MEIYSSKTFLEFISIFDTKFLKSNNENFKSENTLKSLISKVQLTDTFKQINSLFGDTITETINNQIMSIFTSKISFEEIFSNEKFLITKKSKLDFLYDLLILIAPKNSLQFNDWIKLVLLSFKEPFIKNELLDILQGSINNKEDPIHCKEDPIHYKEDPIHYKEGSINNKEGNYKEDPIHYKEDPIHYKEDPIHRKKDLIHCKVKNYWLNFYDKTDLKNFHFKNKEKLKFDDLFFIFIEDLDKVFEKSDLLFKLILFIHSPDKFINHIDKVFDQISIYFLKKNYKIAFEYLKHSKNFEFYLLKILNNENYLLLEYLIERFDTKFLPPPIIQFKNKFINQNTTYNLILDKYIDHLFKIQNLKKIFELSKKFDILNENLVIFILENNLEIVYEKVDSYSQKLCLIEKLKNLNCLLEKELLVFIREVDGFLVNYLVKKIDLSRMTDVVVAQFFLRKEVDKGLLVDIVKRTVSNEK